MLDIKDVQEFVKSINSIFNFDVRLRPSDDTVMLYVPQSSVATNVKPGFTSFRQLNNLKKKLAEEYSVNSEIIFVQNDAQQELESGFYQILNRKFNDQIISLFTSFSEESKVDAYIEVEELTESLQREIEDHFASLLNEAELQLGVMQWLDSPADLPGLIVLLRRLKALQPVDLSGITENIQENYSSVTDKWVSHKLDQLRKKGFLLRQKSTGTYVLTDKALKVIPAGARRTSSDIDRALALGKRKW